VRLIGRFSLNLDATILRMLAKLPGWVVSDETSVAEWRDLSPAQRWRLAILCSRDAMWAARASGHRERILDHADPLPESTARALERLRQRSGWGRGHG
jgi:hypothetical protein